MPFDFEPAVDTFSKERVLETENNTIYLRRYDPYGLVRISFKKGNIPKAFSGEFTSFEEANKVIEWYLAKQGKTSVRTYETEIETAKD